MISALARRLGIAHGSPAPHSAFDQAWQLPVMVHSGVRRPSAPKISVDDAVDGQPQKKVLHRKPAEHLALVATLRQELGLQPGGSPADPPACSTSWPANLLRRWFEDGGNLTVDALNSQPASAEARRLIDMVGCGLPVADLAAVPMGPGGLLGAMRQGNEACISALVQRLADNDCVTCDLGLTPSTLDALMHEGRVAWTAMRPGELRAPDGGTISGRSPSNSPRGDRFVLYRSLDGGPEAWPALAEADEALGAAGVALLPHLGSAGLERLASRSDTFFACFPGDGLGYGSHYDAATLTAILYTTPDWHETHGGRVLMLDEQQSCWWAVPPRSGSLVIFRSDRVLHKVEPCFRTRYALTVFLHAKPELVVQSGAGFLSGGY